MYLKINVIFCLLLCFLTTKGQQLTLVSSLQNTFQESSGLIHLQGRLISHNDSGGEAALYEMDSTNGQIIRTVIISGASNTDWEDICYDSSYIYIADFGNNSGTRTDLKIYRVLIDDYLNAPNDTIQADTIQISYADQQSFQSNTFFTNYDAEAMISRGDSLYIFTKNWGNNWTYIYPVSKQPGNYSLIKTDSINTQGLVTGADHMEGSDTILLCGYTFSSPFIVSITGCQSGLLSEANISRQLLTIPSGISIQIEGLARFSADQYYVTCESSIFGDAALMKLNDIYPATSLLPFPQNPLSIYPNPTKGSVEINIAQALEILVYDMQGKQILSTSEKKLDLSQWEQGCYLIVLKNNKGQMIGTKKILLNP